MLSLFKQIFLKKPSQKPHTILRPAAAGQLAIVMRGAIIAGKFCTFLNGPKAPKLHPVVDATHVAIGLAAVIEITQRIRMDAGIQRIAIAKLHHGYPLGFRSPFTGFPQRNHFATKVANFAPGRNALLRKNAGAINLTRCIRYGKVDHEGQYTAANNRLCTNNGSSDYLAAPGP